MIGFKKAIIRLKKPPTFQHWVLCLLLVWGLNDIVYAQNLIPNPGFENTVECPTEAHDLYLAANWYTNIPANAAGSGIWNLRDYIHTCDPQVVPWWPSELGEAVIGNFHLWDASEDRSLTQLVWTELLSTPEKDSLYYVEYTAGPTLTYYASTDSYIMPWCVPFNLGIKLEGADFDGVINQGDSIVPHMIAKEGGVARNSNNTSQIGNCFIATGNERHFLFGFFLDYTPLDDYTCVGSNAYKDYGWAFFVADNFKLEKMKLEICCDTTVCEKEQIDFSGYTDYYALPEKNIVWNDGVKGAKRSFPVSDRYRFTMVTNCGSVTSNWVNISVEECKTRVYVPNAFSPNGDPINPLFFPVFSPDYVITELQLSIFNRWGNQIFQTNSVQTPEWDGTINGVPANSGIYKWHLKYGYREGDQTIKVLKYGEVFLLR